MRYISIQLNILKHLII